MGGVRTGSLQVDVSVVSTAQDLPVGAPKCRQQECPDAEPCRRVVYTPSAHIVTLVPRIGKSFCRIPVLFFLPFDAPCGLADSLDGRAEPSITGSEFSEQRVLEGKIEKNPVLPPRRTDPDGHPDPRNDLEPRFMVPRESDSRVEEKGRLPFRHPDSRDGLDGLPCRLDKEVEILRHV